MGLLLQIYVCGPKRCLNFGLRSENRALQKLYTQNKHMAQNYWKLFHRKWGGGGLIKAGKEEELCSRLIIRLRSSLEVTIACLLQLYTSSPFLSDYILSTTNGVETGPLSFWGHGSVFFQAGQLHRCPPFSNPQVPKHTE